MREYFGVYMRECFVECINAWETAWENTWENTYYIPEIYPCDLVFVAGSTVHRLAPRREAVHVQSFRRKPDNMGTQADAQTHEQHVPPW